MALLALHLQVFALERKARLLVELPLGAQVSNLVPAVDAVASLAVGAERAELATGLVEVAGGAEVGKAEVGLSLRRFAEQLRDGRLQHAAAIVAGAAVHLVVLALERPPGEPVIELARPTLAEAED